MALPEVKNSTYKLIDVAAEWSCSLEDLFNFAERGLLQICQQRNPDFPDIFSSEGEKAPFFYENEPLEINNFKARELHKRYQDADEPFFLVITDIEKTRFEKKHLNSESDFQGGQHKNQTNVTKKITTEELIPFAQKLQKAEMDQDVVAARLYDEYGARDHQLVKILNIAPHLTSETSEDPEGSRNKAAWRAVKKGRETIAARAVVK